MAHRVDDDIDADFVSRQSILHRVTRIVNPLPRVSYVAVIGNESNKAAIFVFNTHVVRNDAAFF